MAELIGAVPWWAWALLMHVILAAWFHGACQTAPMDTDLWPGGEPRTRDRHPYDLGGPQR